MLNFTPHGYCCILTTYLPALKPKPGVSKHHNLHVLQDGRKSLPLALFSDMWVKAAALPLPTARHNFPTLTDASCTQQKAPGMALQTSSSSSLSLKHRREIHMENTTGSLWGTSTHVLKPGNGEAGGERTPLLRAEKFPLYNQNIS